MTEEKRRLLSPFEKLMLVAAIALIAYIVYQNDDLDVLKRSEHIEIIDKPHSKEQENSLPRSYQLDEEARIEKALEELARQFSGETAAAGNQWDNMAISTDESYYYEGVKQRYGWDDRLEQTADWLKVLQASHRTYKRLQAVFGEASGKIGAEIEADDVDQLLRNKSSANQVYDRIAQVFDIPPTKIQSFADKGRNALSDWAEFIEENQSKK
ncbi:MAG: hypothetical protein AAGG75_11315 [Bacteroidota bacterium]